MLAIQMQRQNLSMVLGFLHKITPTETISSQTPEDGAGIFNHHKQLNFHCHVLKKIFRCYKSPFRQPNQLAVSTNQTIHMVLDFPSLFCQLMLQGSWSCCCFSCYQEQEHQTENKGTNSYLQEQFITS